MRKTRSHACASSHAAPSVSGTGLPPHRSAQFTSVYIECIQAMYLLIRHRLEMVLPVHVTCERVMSDDEPCAKACGSILQRCTSFDLTATVSWTSFDVSALAAAIVHFIDRQQVSRGASSPRRKLGSRSSERRTPECFMYSLHNNMQIACGAANGKRGVTAGSRELQSLVWRTAASMYIHVHTPEVGTASSFFPKGEECK